MIFELIVAFTTTLIIVFLTGYYTINRKIAKITEASEIAKSDEKSEAIKTIQDARIDHVYTVCQKLSTSIVDVLENQKDIRREMNRKIDQMKIALKDQQFNIDMINQDIESMHQSASLSDISIKLELEELVKNFEVKNRAIEAKIKQIDLDIQEQMERPPPAYQSRLHLLG